MMNEYTFNGQTAREAVAVILKNTSTLEEAGIVLSKHEKNLVSIIERLMGELETAYSDFVRALQLDGEQLLSDEKSSLKALEIRESVVGARKLLNYLLGKSEEGEEILNRFWAVFVDPVPDDIIKAISTMKNAIEDQCSLISDSDTLDVKLEAILSLAKQEPEREKLIKFVVDEKRPQVAGSRCKQDPGCAAAARIDVLYEKVIAYKKYRDNLKYESRRIRDELSVLQDEAQEYSLCTKINWIKSQTDCKKLFSFLIANKYIDGSDVNKFISSHFLFNGQSKSAKQLGGLHVDRDGKIEEMDGRNGMGFLKIPK